MRPRHDDGDVATKPQNQFDDGVEVEGLLHFQATLSPLVELTEVWPFDGQLVSWS